MLIITQPKKSDYLSCGRVNRMIRPHPQAQICWSDFRTWPQNTQYDTNEKNSSQIHSREKVCHSKSTLPLSARPTGCSISPYTLFTSYSRLLVTKIWRMSSICTGIGFSSIGLDIIELRTVVYKCIYGFMGHPVRSRVQIFYCKSPDRPMPPPTPST
jgi:hypothetical protein